MHSDLWNVFRQEQEGLIYILSPLSTNPKDIMSRVLDEKSSIFESKINHLQRLKSSVKHAICFAACCPDSCAGYRTVSSSETEIAMKMLVMHLISGAESQTHLHTFTKCFMRYKSYLLNSCCWISFNTMWFKCDVFFWQIYWCLNSQSFLLGLRSFLLVVYWSQKKTV